VRWETVIKLQQDAHAYKKANEVLTERLNEYAVRLKEQGEVLRKILTIREQIAYFKGRTTKKKIKAREKLEIVT